MSCTKQFSLSVVTEPPEPPPTLACLDFNYPGSGWVQDELHGAPHGTASWSANAGHFQAATSITGGVGTSTYARFTGFIFMPKVPSLSARLDITLVAVGAGRVGSINIYAYYSSGDPILTVDLSTLVAGVNQFPFTIPAVPTVGSGQIVVFVNCESNAGATPPPNAGSYSISCDLVCLDNCYQNTEQTSHVACQGACVGFGGDATVAAGSVLSKVSQAAANNEAAAIAISTATGFLSLPGNCCCDFGGSPGAWQFSIVQQRPAGYGSVSGSGNALAAAFECSFDADFPQLSTPSQGLLIVNWCAAAAGNITVTVPYDVVMHDISGGIASADFPGAIVYLQLEVKSPTGVYDGADHAFVSTLSDVAYTNFANTPVGTPDFSISSQIQVTAAVAPGTNTITLGYLIFYFDAISDFPKEAGLVSIAGTVSVVIT